MYELLKDIAQRPEPFSRYTAKELWTGPHLSRQMLDFHLSQETDLASRQFESINEVVNWIDYQLDLPGRRLCDLGCGPGLYTRRFAEAGAVVTGVDFSAHSLEYARRYASEHEQSITYLEADYLEDDLPKGFDIVTLIYNDFCVLSAGQRATLLERVAAMLDPGGYLVMDVLGVGSFEGKEEDVYIEDRFMSGFWAEGDYVGVHSSYVYPEEDLSLDRFTIVEPDKTWEIFNWFQHFTPEALGSELNTAGFSIECMAGDLAGAPLKADGNSIGVIARV